MKPSISRGFTAMVSEMLDVARPRHLARRRRTGTSSASPSRQGRYVEEKWLTRARRRTLPRRRDDANAKLTRGKDISCPSSY